MNIEIKDGLILVYDVTSRVAIFSMNNPSKQKNKIHHDKEHEKTKTMIVFIFSIDNQKGV